MGEGVNPRSSYDFSLSPPAFIQIYGSYAPSERVSARLKKHTHKKQCCFCKRILSMLMPHVPPPPLDHMLPSRKPESHTSIYCIFLSPTFSQGAGGHVLLYGMESIKYQRVEKT